jgi:hypothetical protein
MVLFTSIIFMYRIKNISSYKIFIEAVKYTETTFTIIIMKRKS